MKLKRKGPGSYITEDGEFEVYRLSGRGLTANWQVRSTKNASVFKHWLFGKPYTSTVFNGDTLAECRDAIEGVKYGS